MSDLNQSGPVVRCGDVEQLAVLYACGETDAAGRAALEAHTANCSACAAILDRELRLYKNIASLEPPASSLDPAGVLLAQCRDKLSDTLNDLESQKLAKRKRWQIFTPAWNGLRHAFLVHPAMSMAVLVIISFLAGVEGQHIRSASSVTSPPAVMVTAAPKVTEQQLHSAESANVTWVTPAGSNVPTVQVQLMSQTPMNIVGPADDADIRRALTFVLGNRERFDSDARLDSLEVLRTLARDPDVRSTLCEAALSDANPGVRIKALESLQGLEKDSHVRETLLSALRNDDNSGVRVEAMNLLFNSLSANNESASSPQMRAVFQDRLRNDSNNYIRLKSAAALRQLGFNDLP